MGVLLALLLVPEVLADGATLLSPLFALIEVELPTEGTLDWLAFTLACFSLLQVFPQEILGKHEEQLFQRSAGAPDEARASVERGWWRCKRGNGAHLASFVHRSGASRTWARGAGLPTQPRIHATTGD